VKLASKIRSALHRPAPLLARPRLMLPSSVLLQRDYEARVLEGMGLPPMAGGMENFFPYQIANLAVGPLRVVYAPQASVVTPPAKIQDIVGMVDPYTLAANWLDFGAAINPGTYSVGNTQSGLSIEQDRADVDTEVTDVNRSLQFNVAELSDPAVGVIEQTPGIETIAAVSGSGAQKGVPFGSYSDLTFYRVAFIGRRKRKAGIVTEPGGAQRGRMFAVVLYSAAITGDAKSAQFAKGSLAGMDVTFQAYPDSAATPGKDYGKWLYEAAGTIT
jgi:hypothetical protein